MPFSGCRYAFQTIFNADKIIFVARCLHMQQISFIKKKLQLAVQVFVGGVTFDQRVAHIV